VVVRVPGEVPEWVELGEEGWAGPERAQVRMENALVLNAERVSLMKWAFPVIIENAQNVEQRWQGNRESRGFVLWFIIRSEVNQNRLIQDL
jgi:hypothetical protein